MDSLIVWMRGWYGMIWFRLHDWYWHYFAINLNNEWNYEKNWPAQPSSWRQKLVKTLAVVCAPVIRTIDSSGICSPTASMHWVILCKVVMGILSGLLKKSALQKASNLSMVCGIIWLNKPRKRLATSCAWRASCAHSSFSKAKSSRLHWFMVEMQSKTDDRSSPSRTSETNLPSLEGKSASAFTSCSFSAHTFSKQARSFSASRSAHMFLNRPHQNKERARSANSTSRRKQKTA